MELTKTPKWATHYVEDGYSERFWWVNFKTREWSIQKGTDKWFQDMSDAVISRMLKRKVTEIKPPVLENV